MRTSRVEEVMTERVVVGRRDTPFKDIVAALLDNNVSALPIVDDDWKVVGVVSDADLVLKEAEPDPSGEWLVEGSRRRSERRKSRATVAGALMSAPAIVVGPGDTVAEAAATMRRRRIRRLPVVHPETGRLVGIVTRSDLLRVFLRPDAEIRAEVLDGVLRGVLHLDPRAFQVEVTQGILHIRGEVERWSMVDGLVGALLRVEGLVGVEEQLSYRQDDRYQYPAPAF
ncbi:MAG: CBS domain-containing protein [Streptosporangiales bacterium]|nr:CBS domain-containing protein [Streptosporangiales bacterium]MBO0891319.1 CBS domain-containing protein [Acidothermales bacterium]